MVKLDAWIRLMVKSSDKRLNIFRILLASMQMKLIKLRVTTFIFH